METLVTTALFGGAFAGRRVLVTGHTGFKGSWLALWLRALGAEVGGLALDPDTSPSHWNDLGITLPFDRRVDLRDADGVARAFADFRPEAVFHLAAQPLVRRSYREPAATFAVNVGGLVNVLEAVRATASVRAFVNATTDKVYEHLDGGSFVETAPLGGHDPYSASKACAEIVTSSYRRSFLAADAGRAGPVQVATARAGNVIGGGDWAEDRLVPDLVRAVRAGQALSLRNPRATRPWQHVLEPLSGYLRLGQAMLEGHDVAGAWNFGPSTAAELAVGDVVALLQRYWPALAVAASPGPHPHEAAQLSLDSGKAARALDWKPVWAAPTALQHTAAWYGAYLEDVSLRTADDIATYVADARGAGLAWAG